MPVLMLNIKCRPWKDVVSPIRQYDQIALVWQVNMNPIIVRCP
jgi:hypothetical protein